MAKTRPPQHDHPGQQPIFTAVSGNDRFPTTSASGPPPAITTSTTRVDNHRRQTPWSVQFDTTLIGYARVSAQERNPVHQIDALTRAGVDPANIHIDTPPVPMPPGRSSTW
ncbi:hypothetical protein GCM10010123_46160 [Pilimelia anulata]|uniref:Resolvase/invertase-type recombinase catalytic domain-containing protein n=1 Tax=Pilimelia anulata TaxID=53371 RepID=A0A8J3BFC3_9ACTN|nr:hypothetical protein GCM10010123_46160 [Pilimelia anulata]